MTGAEGQVMCLYAWTTSTMKSDTFWTHVIFIVDLKVKLDMEKLPLLTLTANEA